MQLTTTDPRDREVIHPAGDPQVGHLATPISASGLTETWINNLPAYHRGLSPFRRALEVGMAHGYWLIGPFTKLGPLRDTDVANLAGLLSTIGLVVISTACISLYAGSQPPRPTQTITNPGPTGLEDAEDWNEYASGFLIGGVGGAGFAYIILNSLSLLQGVLS